MVSPDPISQKIGFIAVAFGVIALILVCVGVGTPNWYLGYTATSLSTYYKSTSANFFYSCSFGSDGTFYNCTQRDNGLTYYPYVSLYPWMSDFSDRMRNAGGLCIVGILFLTAGVIFTLVMSLIYLSKWINLLPPTLLFLACLFMLAGMAEGSRFLQYNGYSANLYQAGHLLTMFTLFLSALAAGRIHFAREIDDTKNRPSK